MKLSEWNSSFVRRDLDEILNVDIQTNDILKFDDLVVLVLYGRSRTVIHPIKQPPKLFTLTPHPRSRKSSKKRGIERHRGRWSYTRNQKTFFGNQRMRGRRRAIAIAFGVMISHCGK